MGKFKVLRNNQGFTLIELTVVIIIIGVLSAVIIPQVTKQADKAKVKRAVAEIRSMKAAIDGYYVEAGSLPKADNATNAIGTIASVLEDSGIKWNEITDPWKNGYTYTINQAGDSYRVISPGPGGEINDASSDDIYASDSTEAIDRQKIDKLDTTAVSGSLAQ